MLIVFALSLLCIAFGLIDQAVMVSIQSMEGGSLIHIRPPESPGRFPSCCHRSEPIAKQIKVLSSELDARRIPLGLRALRPASLGGYRLLRRSDCPHRLDDLLGCAQLAALDTLGELIQLPEQLALAVFSSGRTHINPFSAKLSGSAAPATMK